MKIIIFVFSLALVSSVALGASENQKQIYCTEMGGIFRTVALQRDAGMSPQDSFRDWRPPTDPRTAPTEKQVKAIINTVYFDPAFTYAGGYALQIQIIDSCMRGWKPKFQPLK